MPFFEYECEACREIFAELRSGSEKDQPIACPECGDERTRRVLSGFSVGKARPAAPATPCGAPAGSSCGGGSCPMG